MTTTDAMYYQMRVKPLVSYEPKKIISIGSKQQSIISYLDFVSNSFFF